MIFLLSSTSKSNRSIRSLPLFLARSGGIYSILHSTIDQVGFGIWAKHPSSVRLSRDQCSKQCDMPSMLSILLDATYATYATSAIYTPSALFGVLSHTSSEAPNLASMSQPRSAICIHYSRTYFKKYFSSPPLFSPPCSPTKPFPSKLAHYPLGIYARYY